MDPTTTYVIVVIFLATLIRSALGFGEALLAVPLLALRLPIALAAPLAVLVSVLVAGVVVLQDWQKIERRSALWLVAASLPGIPLGLLLLTRVDEHVVKLILGIVIAAFSLYALIFQSRLHLKKDHPGWLLIGGFISGVLGGAYGMNGPPLAIYGSLRRWSPQQVRATLQGYFRPASLLGLCAYTAAGLWTRVLTGYALITLPAVLLAIVIGRAINHRLRGDRFFRIVYAGLFILSAILIGQSVRRAI